MSAKRKQRVSDVAFAEEREMLERKAQGLDEIAGLLTKVDVLIGDILTARERLEAAGMSRMEIVRKLGAVNINRRILRMKPEEWAAEVGTERTDEESPVEQNDSQDLSADTRQDGSHWVPEHE